MKKEMLINVLQPEECRIAIVEDGILEELYVERTSLESYTGNIYKGKIVNLEPAIQAAFVDFSVGRNGFLHVSDVEPQYYSRHDGDEPAPRDREPRRDRGEREAGRRPRPAEEREFGAMPPPRSEERPRERDRDRDRPDRSEKGRRDRSQPRRFGEGLVGDEDFPAPPPLPPAPAPAARAPEPRRDEPDRFEREEPRRPPTTWSDEPAYVRPPERGPEREPEVEEPRARAFRGREPEPLDPDLPPNRTQRSRPSPAPPTRAAEFGDEGDVPRSRLSEPEASPEPPAPREREREPRPRRGRGRPARTSPASDAEALFEPDPSSRAAAEAESGPAPPEADDPGGETGFGERPSSPRRRGGRSAIRSRGGDREAPAPRERPAEPEFEVERNRPAPAEPPAPAAERERERDRDRDREHERPRAPEPEPTRERERDRDRDRGRVHDRAGEPGYVPRRERSRAGEPGFDPEVPAGPLEWAELGAETEADDDLATDEAGDEPGTAAGRGEGPRRRRRRRGRRRERDRPAEAGASPAGDFEDEGDEAEPEAEAEAEPRAFEPARRAPRPAASEADLARDFDFGDEAGDEHDLVHDRYDEEAGDDLRGLDADAEEAAAPSPDDEIDPGLEDEIRREVEEIAELEREMGLRGTTEARPRRGDDREAEGPARGAGGRGFARGRGVSKPPIQEIFRRGDDVLIQVIKESIGTKGPTLSTYISIPGRYLVLMPGLNRVGVSRKIADEGQRRKLREIMNELNPPKGLGFIVRTAGLDRSKRDLARDLAYLLRLWKVILRRIKKAKSPAPIYQESDMITRTIRDIFTAEIDTIWIDEPAAFERAQEFLRVVMPKFVDRLKLYDQRVPLFHKYGIEDEIAKIQRRRVEMPGGGSVVIDQTEALVAIDVNSGNFRVENDAERTAYEMNLRAAKEIARQLRLRDLGGVIVNDFIDMRDERHRRGVEKALRDAIKRDRARTKVLRMSAFGLIEMTRQRIRPSLKRSVYEDCRNCTGAGVVKTVESMSIDVMRLLALASHREDIRRVLVNVGTPVATYLNNRKRQEITRLESEYNISILISPVENVAAEYLQMDCFDGSNGEVRLVPAPIPTGPSRRSHGRQHDHH